MRVLLLGDSITAGCRETGVTAETTYPHLLDAKLKAAHLDVDLVVSALHGVDVDYAVRRFERMVAQHRPDYVLILLGANDAKPPGTRGVTPPGDYQHALTLLGNLCLQSGADPVIASPLPRSDAGCEHPFHEYAHAARTAAKHLSLVFIDLYASFMKAGSLAALVPDGLHPGPAGNSVLAHELSVKLIPLVRNRQMGCRTVRPLHENPGFRGPEKAQTATG